MAKEWVKRNEGGIGKEVEMEEEEEEEEAEEEEEEVVELDGQAYE